MVSEQCKIAYAEVLLILNNITYSDYKKIPYKKIELFKKYAQEDIDFKYNPNLTLEEQNISEKAKIIIALLFRDYWATPLQRQKIIEKEKIDRQKLEQEKLERYNPEDVFKKSNENILQNHNEKQSQEIVKYKESILKKIINKIKGMFYR